MNLSEEMKNKYHEDTEEIRRLLEQNTIERGIPRIHLDRTACCVFTKMMGYLPEKPKDFYNQYDIAMYENARWTEEKFGESIVWAHNGHTAKTNLLPQVYDEIAGQHLAKHYGPKYVSIGTSVTTGQYQAEDETTKRSFRFQLMRTTRKALTTHSAKSSSRNMPSIFTRQHSLGTSVRYCRPYSECDGIADELMRINLS
ncbi:erythromycin esterase family protein [Paenibacillus sp. A3]|uniref:erythromycin esterase family protein n=1 Tax=Paenibacillus sp. A3 TaxID=1337054 RepID=UPI000B20CD86|nr:erythromycin esterase family protein [Paenibacillus sp. A3]